MSEEKAIHKDSLRRLVPLGIFALNIGATNRSYYQVTVLLLLFLLLIARNVPCCLLVDPLQWLVVLLITIYNRGRFCAIGGIR